MPNMNKICVYAICKNESKFVEKWLDSMQEADYIVVLDTGSTDDTVKKLKADKRVTQVKTQAINPWRFDVARNESMKLVPDDANILVCTDLDEVFNVGWGDVLRQCWDDEKYNRVFYRYAWSHSAIGEPQDIFKYDKIHTRDFHWVFPVHEVLEAIDKEKTQIQAIDVGDAIFLHHYPDQSKSRASYFDLLKLSVEENPEESHVRMLLAREYCLMADYENAEKEYLNVLRMPDIDKSEKRLVLLCSLLQLAQIYETTKKYDEALWYCQEFIKEDATYREPYFIMGEIYNDMKMYTLAEACVNAAFTYGTHKYDWVEKATTWYGWGYDILSISKYNLRKLDEAIEAIDEALLHDPNNQRLLKNQVIFLKEKLAQSQNN